MIESPLIQEIVGESRRDERAKTILRVLLARFKTVPPAISAGVEQVKEPDRLERLTDAAASCKTLAAFEKALAAELPQPAPPSTRGRKKQKPPQDERNKSAVRAIPLARTIRRPVQ